MKTLYPSKEHSKFLQRDLLIADGVPVSTDLTVNIKKYRWNPKFGQVEPKTRGEYENYGGAE